MFSFLPERQIRRDVKGNEAEMRRRNKNGEIAIKQLNYFAFGSLIEDDHNHWIKQFC